MKVSRSDVRRLGALMMLFTSGLSCGSGKSPPAPDASVSTDDGGTSGTSRAALLDAFASCQESATAAFLARAVTLDSAAAEAASAPGATSREAVREAFRQAMNAWQLLEPMQFGPAAQSAFPGGQNLRDQIYAWPAVNPCEMDKVLVSQGYDAVAGLLIDRRGLGGLEYLLFREGDTSACATPPAGWAALSADERQARRRAYAAALAKDLRQRATTLAEAWDPAKGNFGAKLRTAGPGNATFPSTQKGLNAVSDAMLYMDNEMKDMKVALPLGCTGATCLDQVESRFAGLSKANLRANLDGVRKLALGCGDGFTGLGFDDLLDAVGAGTLAARLRDRLGAVDAALSAVEEADLPEAISADRPSVQTVHARMRDVTNILKVDFLSVLDLEIPKRLEGDND